MFLKMRKTPSPTSGKTPFRLREKVFLKVFLQQKFYHVAKNTLPVQVLSTCSRKMWGKYVRKDLLANRSATPFIFHLGTCTLSSKYTHTETQHRDKHRQT